MPNKTPIEALKILDLQTSETIEEAKDRISKVQFTPIEGQVAFIKELIKRPEESRLFLDNPKQYSIDHSVLLHPDVVRTITNQVLFDTTLDEKFSEDMGKYVTKDIVDLRSRLKPGGIKPIGPGGDPVNPVANAAVVAAAAAVVMAAAAVVTMVVTLVRAKKPEDLVSLQGLGSTGVILPGNQVFINRTKLDSIAAARSLPGGVR